MEEQIGGGTKDRAELRELTRKLQIISQNADSHIANADVAIISAKCIHAAHVKLHMALESSPCCTERGADTIEYVINSLEKQKLWFLNYKNRKDGMMSLVFNLVTQQDAANSIEIAADTKRDSTSMNAIAALTMIFLLGTYGLDHTWGRDIFCKYEWAWNSGVQSLVALDRIHSTANIRNYARVVVLPTKGEEDSRKWSA